MESPTQRQRSSVSLIFFLFILLGLSLLIWQSLNILVNGGRQSESEGQCLSAGQTFNARQEAFTLAQAAEHYRRIKPFGGNYALASYTTCYKDGTQQRIQSNVFQGYDNKSDLTKPENHSHSEQAAYGWLQAQLSRLSFDQNTMTAIYAIIFSQVAVCDSCKQNMKSWRWNLRQKARTNKVSLSIWDIIPGKGFNPATSPAGPSIPVTEDNLERVNIQFVP